MRPLDSILTISTLLFPIVHAITLDCKHIRAQGKSFVLEELKGPHTVTSFDDSQKPVLSNYTWTIDICAPLEKTDKQPASEQCENGTRVCGLKKTWNNATNPSQENPMVETIPVAGASSSRGTTLDPYILRLNKTDDSPGGLRIELNGAKYQSKKQQAVIEFQCDEGRTGNEDVESDSGNTRRADEDDKKSLTFVSYQEDEDKKLEVLKLKWRTKYVCEDYEEDDDEDSPKKSSWGFFTWFIVLLFMGVAAYLIFGSWLNYNRYGARGWDLLPHGDTIRDVPYIFKDFSRKVLDTFSGGGSRGGYSAV